LQSLSSSDDDEEIKIESDILKKISLDSSSSDEELYLPKISNLTE